MDQDKIRRKTENQTAKDHTAMRRWSQRRRQRYEKLMDEPILPRYCTLCFISMVLGTVLMSLGDLIVAANTDTMLRGGHNAAISAFFTWLLFAALLIPGCAVQLHRGFADPYFSRTPRRKKNGKLPMAPKARLQVYILVACVGLLVLGALALLL